MANDKIEPYVPIQCRPPNQFIKYELRRFSHSCGSGTIRVAHFLNKKKQSCEVEAQIIWDEIPYSKEWQIKYGKKEM